MSAPSIEPQVPSPPELEESVSEDDDQDYEPEDGEESGGDKPKPVGSKRSAPSTPRGPNKKPKVSYHCLHPGCGKQFRKPCKLRRHELSHTGEKPFACDHPGCGQTFSREDHRKRHKQSHDPNHQPYPCEYPGCELVFSLPHLLKRHMKHHAKPRPYECTHEGCDLSFAKANQLRRHECVHTGAMPYMCKVQGCTFGAMFPSKLKNHVRIVHEAQLFKCDEEECGLEFATGPELTQHRKASHPEEYWCHKCSAVLSSARSLSNHLEAVHSVKQSLTSQATYPCQHEGCDRSYSKKSNLQAHIRQVHSTERPYACTHPGCSSAFAARFLLTRHNKIHQLQLCSPALQAAVAPSNMPFGPGGLCLNDQLFGKEEFHSGVKEDDGVVASDPSDAGEKSTMPITAITGDSE